MTIVEYNSKWIEHFQQLEEKYLKEISIFKMKFWITFLTIYMYAL